MWNLHLRHRNSAEKTSDNGETTFSPIADAMKWELLESPYGRPATIPFINDKPADMPSSDFVNYATALSALVNSGKDATDNTPLTIGIFAPWGSGKSTLLKALQQGIQASDREQQRCIIIDFNAWHQENNQQLAASILYTMGNAVKEKAKAGKDGDSLKELGNLLINTGRLITKSVITTLKKGRITIQMPFSLGALNFSAADVDGQSRDPLLGGLSISPSDQLRKNLDAISSLLIENKKRLIVMIDDLDRCNSKEVVQALETISMLSDRSGMVFVLALDHDQIIKALRHEYGTQMDGEKFLEKIIQIPFWIPSSRLANADEVDNPIKVLIGEGDWGELESNQWINSDLLDGINVIVQGPLRSNPRQTKRFLNTFLLLSYIHWKDLHNPDGKNDKLKNFTYFLGMQIAWPNLQHRLIRSIDESESAKQGISNTSADTGDGNDQNAGVSTFKDIPLVSEICETREPDKINQSLVDELNEKFAIGLTNTDDLKTLQNYLTFNEGTPYSRVAEMNPSDVRELISLVSTGTDRSQVDMSHRDVSKWYWDDGKKKYTKLQLLRLIGKRYQEEHNFAKDKEFKAAFGKEIEKCMQDIVHKELNDTFNADSLLDVDDQRAAEDKIDFHINGSDQAYSIDWWCGFKPGTKSIGERVHRPLIEYFQAQGYPISMA